MAEEGTLVVPIHERFIQASEVPDAWGLNGIFYGDPGAGKTTLLSTAQDSKFGKDLFMLDVEGGSRSISDREDIGLFRPDTWGDVGEWFDYIVTEDHKFRSFGIDSLTALQALGLKHLVKQSGRDRPSQDEYVMSNALIKAFVADMVGLSKERGWNVLFTAIVREFPDRSGGLVARPALTDRAVEDVVQLCDMVAYLAVDGEGQRKLHLAPSGIYTAKVRQPKGGPQLPASIEDPDLGQILDIMRKGG